MLFGNRMLVTRLRDIDSRLVEFFARQRSLLEELLPALINLLLGIERLLGLLRFGFGFLDFLGQAAARWGLVRRLCLIVSAFILLSRRCQVAIFQHRQQLALMHVAATI